MNHDEISGCLINDDSGADYTDASLAALGDLLICTEHRASDKERSSFSIMGFSGQYWYNFYFVHPRVREYQLGYRSPRFSYTILGYTY